MSLIGPITDYPVATVTENSAPIAPQRAGSLYIG
jgi:hypothetical protein